MLIEDLMTEAPTCCTPGTSVHDVAEMMAENACGAVPVVEEGDGKHVVGVVTDRDIVVRAVAKRKPINHVSAREVMTQTPVTVVASGDEEDVREAMSEHQLRRVLVCDGGGACVGIVAQADLARTLPPEVVGDTLRRVSQPAAAPAQTQQAADAASVAT